MSSAISISTVVFACVFGGALGGMALRAVLPEHHRTPESRDLVKLGMGLIATMAALLLGLLVASAKGSYDTQKDELTQMTARMVFLDRVLAHYGPEAQATRELLRNAGTRVLGEIWPRDPADASVVAPTAAGGDAVYDRIQALAPQDDAQRALKAQASSLAIELGQLRWLMFEQRGSSVSTALLVIVVFWLTVIFVSFGIFAPPNATVTATLFVCALSVSCAIFLILEMDRPFDGMIRISSVPLRDALAHLGQ
jgi:hypothetical protein